MYLSLPLGVGVDSLVFIHLIPRIDHKIRMVINRLNHQYRGSVKEVCRSHGRVRDAEGVAGWAVPRFPWAKESGALCG